MSTTSLTHHVRVLAAPGPRHDEILTPAALDFVGGLVEAFQPRRRDLMKERRRLALRLASGSPSTSPRSRPPCATTPRGAWHRPRPA